jgi:hypothetical protein
LNIKIIENKKGVVMKKQDTKKSEGTKLRAKAMSRKPSVAKTSSDAAIMKALEKEKEARKALEAELKNYGVRDVEQEDQEDSGRKSRKPSVAKTSLDAAITKAFLDEEKEDRKALEAELKNYGVRDVE